jgi:hypothetical protein
MGDITEKRNRKKCRFERKGKNVKGRMDITKIKYMQRRQILRQKEINEAYHGREGGPSDW